MSQRYTVEYCANWDGGGQEFNTVRAAILAIHPDADVIGKRVDAYPIYVKVFDDVKKKLIWNGDQRNLFSKNAAKREASVKEIKSVL